MEIHPCCVFFPDSAIVLEEPTMNIALNMKTLYRSGQCLNTVLLCLPHLRAYSTAHRRVAPVLELPVKVMEQSISGAL